MLDLDHIFFAGIEGRPRTSTHRCASTRLLPWHTDRRAVSPRAGDNTLPAELDPFVVWLLDRAGLDATVYRPNALQRRLAACLRQLHVSSPSAAMTLLQRKLELMPTALSAMLIGVSELFRDRLVFQRIQDVVLPELLETRAHFRVYSAGVSDGHELYSVAILLAEAGALERAELLGADCRADALARAEAGIFDSDEINALPPSWRTRYFHRRGNQFVAHAALRQRMRWIQTNVLTFVDGSWDVILFRNVAIYLTPAAATRAWGHLQSQLAPGGFLVTGKAEKPPGSLALRNTAPNIYRRSDD